MGSDRGGEYQNFGFMFVTTDFGAQGKRCLRLSENVASQ